VSRTVTRAFAALVRRTPLVPAPELGDAVWLKLENLQRTGSFKVRGACLRLDALTDEERARGVVTASAGNHGQGVAIAGGKLGIRTEVYVPTSAPAVKKQAIAALGARVVEEGANYDAAEAAARRRAADAGAVFVSAFDDPYVIRGNGGSLGDEIRAQLPHVAEVVTPVGGGGLVGGLADALVPVGVRVRGVQTEVNCAMHDSLREGAALTRYEGQPTIAEGCDGAVAESTYERCRRHGVQVDLVSEAAIRRAVAFAYRRLGLLVEATGAVAIAGLLEHGVPRGTTGPVVVVVSGGNIGADTLDGYLAAEPDDR
jgi:threonine dehydratase